MSRHLLLTVFLAGGITGGVLIASVAVTWTRLTRTWSDLTGARANVRGLRRTLLGQAGELARGLGVVLGVLAVGVVLYLVGSR